MLNGVLIYLKTSDDDYLISNVFYIPYEDDETVIIVIEDDYYLLSDLVSLPIINSSDPLFEFDYYSIQNDYINTEIRSLYELIMFVVNSYSRVFVLEPHFKEI